MLVASTLIVTLLAPADSLTQGFLNPPHSAKPHTWWHWMDGNVTKEGITADLEAMKQVGIGGAQMFTVAQGIPKGPVDYMSPAWREMTSHAIKEAGRLGIELCIHNCAGWSSSGGPWVKPEHAMQVLAWSTVDVAGPQSYSRQLPVLTPPQIYGSVPYARDIAVFAFKKQAPAFTQKNDPRFLGKTGVVRQDGLEPTPSKVATLDPAQVLDLTKNLTPQGTLNWQVPAGEWTVLRMGHVPTGKDNHPAPPEGDGLEVDKLSREALDAFWQGTMATVLRDNKELAGKVLNNALVDSYEVGSQNWTPKMREEFKKRRGYDPLPWLPVIAGYAVDTPEKTERFLWDWRRTIADLYADNYYGYFGELCHRNGILFSTEPYGNGGFDNLQAGGKADIPMGEFWVGGGTLETTKIASSVAHVYGRKYVGAESFTADDTRGRWLEEPYAAKALGDLVFCNGVNRYIFHRYAHQPWMNLKPGMTMGPWGTHLERTQTWWTEAAEWMRYVARCQFMLQQGQFVADVVYFTGEGAPADLPYRPNLKPSMPNGYDYDGCSASALLQAKAQDGRLVFPSGMSYRLLVLPESKFMTPQVASKVAELSTLGVAVVGPKPSASPSLVGYPEADAAVRRIAGRSWGMGVVPVRTALAKLKLQPDFEWKSSAGVAKLAYIHRKVGSSDVYFVSNQSYGPAEVEATFRISGRLPELWHADTGSIEPAPAYRKTADRTTVSLRFEPAESVFVVFRSAAPKAHVERVVRVDSKSAAPKAPEIVIRHARYETADGRGADVTSIVSQVVREGANEVTASNGLFGDPVVNVVKQLVVDYTIDGKAASKTVAENETLVFFTVPGAPEHPDFRLTGASGTTLVPFRAGRYLATTSTGRVIDVAVREGARTMTIDGPWRLKFAPNLGAPPSIELPKLASWTDNADAGVRYFSGSATYRREFEAPKGIVEPGRSVQLDLGVVKNFATVWLNGRKLAVLWKAPFVVDLGKAIQPGRNVLEVKVTNLWPNRIIGDEQLEPDVEWNGVILKGWPDWLKEGKPRPKTGRITFTTWRFWNKDSKLLESGLLGPVTIRSVRPVPLR